MSNTRFSGLKATSISKKKSLDYAQAGVNIDAGNQLVDAIKPLAAATRRPWANASLGGFGAILDLKAAGFNDPLIISATDGVGTKLKLAIDSNRHSTIGIDLVAMCVNDLIVQGAKPLVFLDYYACGSLNVAQATSIVQGIAEGCIQAGAALVGGETAEMPGMYQAGDYDLAGFAIGAVEREKLIDENRVKAGDILLGLASSGPHSNGYSLIRKVLALSKAELEQPPPFKLSKDGKDMEIDSDESPFLIDILLAPTRIYVNSILSLLAKMQSDIHGLCHITGGGFYDNIPRILPKDLAARLDKSKWEEQAIFKWLAEAGGIEAHEMHRSFNCGIGMVIAVNPNAADNAVALLTQAGEKVYRIGHIEKLDSNQEQVTIKGIDA